MAKKEWKQRLIPKKALFRASLIWETWVQTCYNYERMIVSTPSCVSFSSFTRLARISLYIS